MAANSPEFFKVFLPDRSSKRILIPPSFVKKYCEFIPRKVDLKDPTGKLWKVNVKEVGKNLFIQNGWRDFVAHYALKYGDFLIFTWGKKSVFDVKLFGGDGCLKRKKNVLSVVECIADVNPPPGKKVGESGVITLPAKKAKESTGVIAPPARKEKESTPLQMSSSRFPRACKRSSAQVASKKKNDGSSEGPRRKSRRLDEGGNGENCEVMILDEEPFVRPNTPHFVALMKKTYRLTMYVPINLLKENGIKLPETLVLRDHNDKLWPLKVSIKCDGRSHLGAGWSDFHKHMELEEDDKCLFEFVLGRGKVCKELKVQVFYSDPARQELLGMKGNNSWALAKRGS